MIALVEGCPRVQPPSGRTSSAVLDLVRSRTGLVFSAARMPDAEAGIRRALARAGSSETAFVEDLRRNSSLFNDLVEELTVGETYFFREPGNFDFVRRAVLPLLAGEVSPSRPLRAWSAGTATGEEAYSLAVLLHQGGFGERSTILGTDISQAALRWAEEGRYRAWSVRGEAEEASRAFLARDGELFVVPRALRRRVTFRQLNLAEEVYPDPAAGLSAMDLIFCRNVLIYFDPPTVRAIARRLYDTLAPGGWLVTASSDPPLGKLAPFEVVVNREGVFYRRPGSPGAPDREPPRPDPRRPLAPLPPAAAARAVPAPDLLAQASRAYERGEWSIAAELAGQLPSDRAACALLIRSIANARGPLAASESAARSAEAHPDAPEFPYFRGFFLAAAGLPGEALASFRRALYLDRRLAVAHFGTASAGEKLGDHGLARRGYRNALGIASGMPPSETVPLSDGETAARFAEGCRARLGSLRKEGS